MFKSIYNLVVCTVAMAGAYTSAAQSTGPFTTSTPIPLSATDWSGTLSFPQFDPSLGILNSVELSFSSTTTTLLTVQNISNLFGPAKPSSGTASSQVQITVQDGANDLSAPAIVLLSNYAFSLAAGGSVNSGLLTQNASGGNLYTLSAVLSEFTGTGSISLSASTFTQSGLTYTGGTTFAGLNNVDASLTGTVTYNYTSTTPTPEPTVMALAGLSGISLILFRRYRK